MADYTPPFVEGRIITSTASAAVTGGDVLEVSGNGTVAKCASLASLKVVGVCASDTLINGRVSFWCRGPVHESLADGTVTAGDQLTSTGTAGRGVKTLAPSAIDVGGSFVQATVNAAINGGLSADRAVIGVALTTAADGAKVRWMLTF